MLSKNHWHSLYYLRSLLPTIHFLQPILILVTQSQNYGYFLLTRLCFPPEYLTSSPSSHVPPLLFSSIPLSPNSADSRILKIEMWWFSWPVWIPQWLAIALRIKFKILQISAWCGTCSSLQFHFLTFSACPTENHTQWPASCFSKKPSSVILQSITVTIWEKSLLLPPAHPRLPLPAGSSSTSRSQL